MYGFFLKYLILLLLPVEMSPNIYNAENSFTAIRSKIGKEEEGIHMVKI